LKTEYQNYLKQINQAISDFILAMGTVFLFTELEPSI